MIKPIIRFFKRNKSIGAAFGSLFLAAFMTAVVMMPVDESRMLANLPDFRWIFVYIMFFFTFYSLIVIENVMESYKSAIRERDNNIDYLKQLLFDKEEKDD